MLPYHSLLMVWRDYVIRNWQSRDFAPIRPMRCLLLFPGLRVALLITFCFVSFCFVLLCFVLFCFILLCFVFFLFLFVLFCLFCFYLFCFTLPSSPGHPPYAIRTCERIVGHMGHVMSSLIGWGFRDVHGDEDELGTSHTRIPPHTHTTHTHKHTPTHIPIHKQTQTKQQQQQKHL